MSASRTLEHLQMSILPTHPDPRAIAVGRLNPRIATHMIAELLEHPVKIVHGGFGLVGGEKELVEDCERSAGPRPIVCGREPAHPQELLERGAVLQPVLAVAGIDGDFVNAVGV